MVVGKVRRVACGDAPEYRAVGVAITSLRRLFISTPWLTKHYARLRQGQQTDSFFCQWKGIVTGSRPLTSVEIDAG